MPKVPKVVFGVAETGGEAMCRDIIGSNPAFTKPQKYCQRFRFYRLHQRFGSGFAVNRDDVGSILTRPEKIDVRYRRYARCSSAK